MRENYGMYFTVQLFSPVQGAIILPNQFFSKQYSFAYSERGFLRRWDEFTPSSPTPGMTANWMFDDSRIFVFCSDFIQK